MWAGLPVPAKGARAAHKAPAEIVGPDVPGGSAGRRRPLTSCERALKLFRWTRTAGREPLQRRCRSPGALLPVRSWCAAPPRGRFVKREPVVVPSIGRSTPSRALAPVAGAVPKPPDPLVFGNVGVGGGSTDDEAAVDAAVGKVPGEECEGSRRRSRETATCQL